MKRLLSLLLALIAFPAWAQLPGGGLNIGTTPITGGPPVVGDCLTVGTGNTLSQGSCGSALAAITANSFLANFTGSSAVPIGNAIPACTSGQSLQYTAGSGFSCVTQVVFLGVTGTITVGYSTTTPSGSGALGTLSSGTTTLACANGQVQNLTNGGSFTLAAPTGFCPITLTITNNGSAGTITWSSFSGSKHGDAITTVNGSVFIVSIIPSATSGSPFYVTMAQQ